MMKTISILAISFYLLACGDSPDSTPIAQWVGTWQGQIDDASRFMDWDSDYLFTFDASGDFEVRHRESGDLLIVGVITVTDDEFSMNVTASPIVGLLDDNDTDTISGIWTRTGEYLRLRYDMNGERESLLKWYP